MTFRYLPRVQRLIDESRCVMVTFGGGTNGTAMLIEMVKRGEPRPHAIIFADTGNEHPHTYAHIKVFSLWLVQHGYPPITIVRRVRETLYEFCTRLSVLPALAYGWKTCSLKFKVEPQQKWANNDEGCRAEWNAGRLVTKIIGFDADEEHRVRDSDNKYVNRYPLIEWGMDREACKRAILGAGLKLPGKSSCWFCPNMEKKEIVALRVTYPHLLKLALKMEAKAIPNLRPDSKVKGLGRSYSWRDFLKGKKVKEIETPMPCDCYDGAAEAYAEERV